MPCVLTIAAAMIAPFATAATPISAPAIDATIARTMNAFDVPGIAVAVVEDDETVDDGAGAGADGFQF